ncbi:hypothetical protein P167DRAFT_567022 [Morchella conica CCBAS932]|uniref:Uncharacterized protein n=1 Tax=Morchella conica CCBAS932 TaxID=1392247 RepID=A0A3N4KKM7_9PEZI|nr:hypothetical protein P167DRAFT_567022 [Morchella conica CCBAS932]
MTVTFNSTSMRSDDDDCLKVSDYEQERQSHQILDLKTQKWSSSCCSRVEYHVSTSRGWGYGALARVRDYAMDVIRSTSKHMHLTYLPYLHPAPNRQTATSNSCAGVSQLMLSLPQRSLVDQWINGQWSMVNGQWVVFRQAVEQDGMVPDGSRHPSNHARNPQGQRTATARARAHLLFCFITNPNNTTPLGESE